MLTLDTSGILALVNDDDPYHAEALHAVQKDSGPFFVPAGIMAEVAYMIEDRLGADVLATFLADLDDGAFALDFAEGDLRRVRELIDHYRDLDLGYADSAVVATAERHNGRVLTYDLRHFAVVARAGTIALIGFEG